jgi:hypothetical protein
MSPRSIRRAAERRQQKLARRTAREFETSQPAIEPSALELETSQAPDDNAVSPARLAANRANAQLSTGPTSPEGRAKSSLNAVKTALTGRTVLLPADDADAYEQHLRDYDKEFKPMTPRECALVQSLADTAWRLDRIPGLEMAIYAQGRIQFADHEPDLIDLQTFLAYEKQLRNLQLQEARLHRRREKDMAELRQMQQERSRREREELDVAAKLYNAARHDNKPFDPAELGFDFSIEDVETYLEGVRAAQLLNSSLKQEDQRARAAHTKAA